jgi:3-hydroxyisobutyrate dehydrogenase-like beta-hydroxyacid dehydrogenase
MKTVGVIGIGDMGSGLAKNLIKNGYTVTGIDLLPERQKAFAEMGGLPAASAAEVGRASDVIYVMVMTGAQAKEVILGPDGVVANMNAGGAVILTATVHASEAREIAADAVTDDAKLHDLAPLR